MTSSTVSGAGGREVTTVDGGTGDQDHTGHRWREEISEGHDFPDSYKYANYLANVRKLRYHKKNTVEEASMSVSYNKLWKLMIDRRMKKKDLQELAGISASLITKLGREEPVTTTVLMKICDALNCDIGEIMEVIPNMPRAAE